MLTLVMRTLEVLRDLFIILPLSTKQLEDPANSKFKVYTTDFKEYIDKIVIERRFTARFVNVSGQQNMMFGLWYLVLTFTSKI